MPPPSLSIEQRRRPGASFSRLQSRPFWSWKNATSPIRHTVGRSDAAATPKAVDTTPSMPLAPRFPKTWSACCLGCPNASRSRTGMEEDTNRQAPSGSIALRTPAMSPSCWRALVRRLCRERRRFCDSPRVAPCVFGAAINQFCDRVERIRGIGVDVVRRTGPMVLPATTPVDNDVADSVVLGHPLLQSNRCG